MVQDFNRHPSIKKYLKSPKVKVKDIFKRFMPIMPAGSWLQRGGDGVMDQGCTWLELSVEGLDQSDC